MMRQDTHLIDVPGLSLDLLVHQGCETDLFRGRRRADGVPIAVKVTHGDHPTFRQLARLRREHAILSDLHLPGVPRVLDILPYGRGLALVLEDLGPTSMADFLARRGPLDATTTLRIAVPLVRTLDALHQRRVVHKDIKPRNVMIDEATLAPRLIDFGISARLAQETQEASALERLEGTLAYIAPEQTGRMNRPVDRRSDLYAFGVTLYEMLTGDTPFAAADPIEAIHAHLTRVPAPPHAVVDTIPRGLSDVVVRLLAKAPEDRYQSARGLLSDLEVCRQQLDASGTVEPFPLGQDDLVEDVVLPDRLVGREAALGELAPVLARSRAGEAILALVAGPSGIGKSALVRELCATQAREAYLASGKFDSMTRSTPLSAFSQVIRALVQQALIEPADALRAKKSAIEAALGPSGRILTDLCPDLEFVTGPQPEPPAVGAGDAKNRLLVLIRRFLSVFSREGAPLCLFFDDLQWADPASLDLLGRLITDPDTRHLCVIGAYRDDEVDAAHPLTATMRTLREAGIEPFALTLGPLSPASVTAIVAEALHADPASVEPLAAVIEEKTHANPLFIGQFLRALVSEGLLRFDPEARRFVWDITRVKGVMATDNVLALMARKIEGLAPATRRALTCAACIGPSFDLRTLATILEKSPAATAADLWEALSEGLLQPISGDYRLLEWTLDELDTTDVAVRYRFLHDRVKEACYAIVPAAERPTMHLAIGRLLVAHGGGKVRDEDLLEVVRHLNLGAQAITDEAERMDVARLNLRAGRRAMSAAAFEAASSLFGAGRALASEEAFARDHDMCFALWLEGAEAAYLMSAFDDQEALTKVALERAKSANERASVYSIRARALLTSSRFADALRAGRAGLGELGVVLPEDSAAQQAAFMEAIGDIDRLLVGRPIESLGDGPRNTDPRDALIFKLMNELIIAAYSVQKSLYGLIVVEQVRLSLTRGNVEQSAVSYMLYCFILCAFMGRHTEGYAFGKFAVSLCERWKSPALDAHAFSLFTHDVHYGEPLRKARIYGLRGLEAAVEVGDNVNVNMCHALPSMLVATGMPLEEVAADTERCLACVRRTKDAFAIASLTVSRQFLACLKGQTRSRTSLDSDGVVIRDVLAPFNEAEFPVPFCYERAYQLFLHVLYCEHGAALEAAIIAARGAAGVMGTYWPVNSLFLEALARAGVAHETEDPAVRNEHAAAIESLRAQLEPFVRSSPENFKHKVTLIDAELAALRGERWEALEQYDQAIELARENGYSQDEAITNERCGRFLRSLRRDRAAQGYLADAFRGFLHWGATAKAEALLVEFPTLVSLFSKRDRSSPGSVSDSAPSHTTLLGRTTMGSLRDAALVLRAAQTIAGELVLSRVVSRLMQIVLENSGAERGILLLAHDGRLFVEASIRGSAESIEMGQRRLLEDEPEIAQQAVLYTWRTREVLVLDDARVDARFRADPYVNTGRARSVLCLPVSSQGRAAGILYLENGATPGVFTAVRVELLGLLASQAAIAIENALLLEGIQAANEETHLANARLEGEVKQRTRELERSNAELARELDDRTRAEIERAALQEQVVSAQKARLLELMAPLLPISEDVLVMPIIGSVDAERAEQLREVALAGAQQTGARALILDITGMRGVDANAVSALVSVADALRLLGTEPLFTGIRAEVARTMVEIGVDLRKIPTLSTLRMGIARALSRSTRAK